MMKYISMKTVVSAALLLAAGLGTLAMKHAGLFNREVPPPVNTGAPLPKIYDPVLVKKLETVLDGFSGARPKYTYAGSISVSNPADTTEKMNHVPFLLCKDGKDLYYRMAGTEMINANDACLTVDSVHKRVFVSAQKQVNVLQMMNTDLLHRCLQEQDYSLTSKREGTRETITLLNEHNASCKQYSIAYDTLSKTVTRIFSRLGNFREPENSRKDKLIEIDLSRYEQDADLSRYTTKAQVIGAGGKLRAKYADYQLIHL
jgi:hypothetical protein